MSDVMLHGVLTMPPELWDDSELDKQQRYSRYLEASRRIEDLERELTRASKDSARLEWLLNNCGMEIISPVLPEYPNWKICWIGKVKGEGKTAREAIDLARENDE